MGLISSWQPSADIDILKKRSLIIQKIRAFFFDREFIEVETPMLSAYGVTDPYNENITCEYFSKIYFLQTSPEYHLKRLLCAGAPNLFQLSKAFRHEASSKHHNPEFTMLEWYRNDWGYRQLMDEVVALVSNIMPKLRVNYYTYQNLFINCCNFDPLNISVSMLVEYSIENKLVDRDLKMDKDAWLSLIMSQQIEPWLTKLNECSVIYDYPNSQSSLAIIEGDIAKRFEIYINGIELANGFEELRDPNEQYKRFREDNTQRKREGKNQMEIDPYFISALKHGLNRCSGVALGIDRFIMAVLKLNSINQAISFSIDRA